MGSEDKSRTKCGYTKKEAQFHRNVYICSEQLTTL